jgi:hypothetical protein
MCPPRRIHCARNLALPERITHPGNHGFPDATFDFIFAKGLTASQPTIPRTTASDHWPVTRSSLCINICCGYHSERRRCGREQRIIPKYKYAAVGNADTVVLDYVIRRFDLPSARLNKPQGLDLR